METIKVMIIEEDPFWQSRLTVELNQEQDIEVIGVAANGEEALATATSRAAHVILMDLHVKANQLDGFEILRELARLKEASSRPKIIILTSIHDEEVIVRSFQNGANNFLSKSSYPDIAQAIRDAYACKSAIHSDAAAAIVRELQLGVLTAKEKEIYRLKKQGCSITQISEKLHKSVNTIKTQMKNIKKKMIELGRLE